MKRTSLTLSLLLLFAGGVVSQVPDKVHEKCKDARDYVGCIQVLTGTAVSKEEVEIEEIKNLKKALALLPSRLQNTSLRDFSMAIQPFTDALAAAEAAAIGSSDYSLEDKTKILKLANPSLRLSAAIDIYRSTWSQGIEWDDRVGPLVGPSCSLYDVFIENFNNFFESNVLKYHNIEQRAYKGRCELSDRIHRDYEGKMLYYIVDAVSTIMQTGKFPASPYPFKTLSEITTEYITNEQRETKEDILIYKEKNAMLEEPWQISRVNNTYKKRDLKRTSNKIYGLRGIPYNNNINIFFKSEDKGLNEKEREEVKLALKKYYSYDFDLAIKSGWFRYDAGPLGKLGPIYRLLEYTNLLGESYFRTTHGERNSNLIEAEKLFVGSLSIDIQECRFCYDSDLPNQNYLLLLHQRKHAKEMLNKIIGEKKSNEKKSK